jgi:hypothetical protein
MSAAPVTADRSEILKAIKLLCNVDRNRGMQNAYELRIPGADHGVVGGLFSDPDKLADAAAEWSGRAPGVYVTLNPVAAERVANKASRLRSAAKDKEIVRRCRLLIDFDPTRPDRNTSSTDEEKAAALALALQVRDYLTGRGWPAPILGDSGNGYHLVYAINLPNDNPSTWLVEGVLKGLDRRFSSDAVKVDTSVYNAGRISKLYGTMACKGPNTADRPHRLTRIVEAPDLLGPVFMAPVDADKLNELADELRDKGEDTPPPPAPSKTTPTGTPFDVDRYLHEHHVAVKRDEPYEGGHRWILKACPFNPDHAKGSDTAVLQLASGAVVFKCQHDSCAGTTWKDFKEAVEDRPLDEDEVGGEPAGPRTAPEEEEQAIGVVMSSVTAERVEWLWAGRLARGKMTITDGDPDQGKSTRTMDTAARVTRGLELPDGGFAPQGGVVIVSLEDGLGDTLRPRLDAAGADVDRVLAIQEVNGHSFNLLEDLWALEQAIHRINAIYVVLDPLTAMLGKGTDVYRDNDVRRILAPVALLAERTGVAVDVQRHLTKGGAGGNPIYRGGGSIGIIGAARVGLLIAPDRDNPETKVLAVTKSNLCRKASSLAFTIEEIVTPGIGPVPRIKWLGPSSKSAADLLAPPDATMSPKQGRVVNFLRQLLEDGPVTANVVWAAAAKRGFSTRAVNAAKLALGVFDYKVGLQNGWMWELPGAGGGK